jgi:ribosome-associated toxin RatA of RatAB toxin-antitoxin module
MTRLSGSCQAEIPFSIERCWAVVADVERAPEWQRTLTRVTVLERDDRGRVLVADTDNDARLRTVKVRVRFSYSEPERMSYRLVESDDLDAMDGGWTLESLGPERTRATYELAVDPGPIGFLARPLERAIRPIVMGHQADELAREVAARGG